MHGHVNGTAKQSKTISPAIPLMLQPLASNGSVYMIQAPNTKLSFARPSI
jgi:hypothetical protein